MSSSLYSVQGQEYQYKGAFIYQFARIFEWSALQGNVFTIAVYGDSDITPILNQIAKSKKLGNRSIVVKKANDPGDLANCQIVFVPTGNVGSVSKIQSAVKGKNVLVVTEAINTEKSGSGINFIEVDEKILFEINRNNITSSGLQLPLSLQRLAHKVY